MRITSNTLNAVATRINRVLKAPEMPFQHAETDGKFTKWAAGHWFVKQEGHRIYTLQRIENEHGAASQIITADSPRDLYDAMHAFLAGIRVAVLAGLTRDDV